MKIHARLAGNSGLSIVEVLVAIGVLSVFVAMSLIFSDSINHGSHLGRTRGTRDRISSGVGNMSSMPAALRNSMRAALPDGVTPFNPDFHNCVAGKVVNGCENNKEYPLSLFSPTVVMTPAGVLVGIIQITSAVGTPAVNHFDSFGVPCVVTNPDCLFVVHTSFRAQCPPEKLPPVPPATSDPAYLALMSPKATCTVAEAVNVTFQVEVDPAALAANPSLASFNVPMKGTVATSVKLIFGNDPF